MRWVRFESEGTGRYGQIEDDHIVELNGPFFEMTGPTGREFPLSEACLLSPVVPGKVVCVGKNYAGHIKEMGGEPPEEPCLFIKPGSSVIGPDDDIRYPAMSSRVDYEAELAVVIGRRLRHASPGEAADAVFGYTCLNDVTARDLQKKDGQWTRAKGFDTFCPIGPWIEDGADPSDLEITALLNGEVKQQARTSLLIHRTFDLISFISRVMTLLPGDVVATGTPAGIGPMRPGDTIEVRIEGIGALLNKVVKDS